MVTGVRDDDAAPAWAALRAGERGGLLAPARSIAINAALRAPWPRQLRCRTAGRDRRGRRARRPGWACLTRAWTSFEGRLGRCAPTSFRISDEPRPQHAAVREARLRWPFSRPSRRGGRPRDGPVVDPERFGRARRPARRSGPLAPSPIRPWSLSAEQLAPPSARAGPSRCGARRSPSSRRRNRRVRQRWRDVRGLRRGTRCAICSGLSRGATQRVASCTGPAPNSGRALAPRSTHEPAFSLRQPHLPGAGRSSSRELPSRGVPLTPEQAARASTAHIRRLPQLHPVRRADAA